MTKVLFCALAAMFAFAACGKETAPAPAAAVAANTPAPPVGELKGWTAGTHFIEYATAQRVSAPPGQIEVTEAFWYGCGVCYSLEPQLVAWEKTKPAWIKLRRAPVVWNEVTREDARIYFTLEG